MVLFVVLPLEAAFHKFSTLLLITFDPLTQSRSNFFQTMCNRKAYPSKMILSFKVIAVVHHKPQN